MTDPLVFAEGLSKRYDLGGATIQALDDVSFSIAVGEFLGVVGRSGSGKSTLMSILGLLDRPDAGRYYLKGREVANLSEDERAFIRNREIGFVFQMASLLSRSSAIQNVEMPLIYAGLGSSERRRRARTSWALGSHGALASTTLGRRAAARRDCPRAGQ